MICTSCYHYDICSKESGTTNYYGRVIISNDVDKICKYFKNKSLIIELPYRLRDKVYKIISGFNDHIQEMTIQNFALIAHTDFGIIDQWNLIYPDKSKAETRLKELTNNG